MITQHTWYERAKSDCGYIWSTNPGEGITCACGGGALKEGILTGHAHAVTNEVEFKQAVADDLKILLEELELIDGSA